ncbi:MAG TPA: NAD-dependent deacylase [Vicinamibacteria bacterium]|nr:NAD-dependent deacylase [Vicinamibacteria bacterium]
MSESSFDVSRGNGLTASEVAARLRAADRVLVLTGAGVSAESGVPTFRGPGGLWRSHRPEDLATPEAFARDPALVWEWYAWRRQTIATLRPNPAHLALAAVEARSPHFLLATQNVDGLHQVAGSRRLVELHGSLWRLRCTTCGQSAEDGRVPLPELPPRCPCGARLRPDVVWFGEALPEHALGAAFAAAREADVVLVVGTSSLVYPAASLPQVARAAGAFVVEVNPEATPLTPLADVSLRGTAAAVVPTLVEGA